MEEIWKVIEDSDGHYFISNTGKLYREEYEFQDTLGKHMIRKQKLMEQGNFNKKNGYYSYRYRGNNGEPKKNYVHRLVAKHFVVNPDVTKYNQINHIDCDKSNNYFDNLEWVNTKLNMEHASKNNLINKDSEKRKCQTRLNQKISVEKNTQIWCKYNKDGLLIESVKGGYSQWARRLTYKGYTWRSGEELLKQYNNIPDYLDVTNSFKATGYKRKIYVGHQSDGCTIRYKTLASLPIAREDLWYAYNHNIPDKNGTVWDIIEPEDGEIIPHKNRVRVKLEGYDEQGNLILNFESLKDCMDFLNIKGANALIKAARENKLFHGYYWKKEWRI